jgi:integrase
MEESAMYPLTYKPTLQAHREPWNKGKLVGPKPPCRLQEIWEIRIRLDLEHRVRELAMSDLAINSKLRGCDLVQLKVSDVMHGRHAVSRALLVQQKTQQPVRFEITEQTRDAIEAWVDQASLRPDDYLFPSRVPGSPHLSTRQYARIVKRRAAMMGRNPREHGTHSLRRTKVTLIYRRTKNLRAVQLLLDHTKLESSVRYLGIEVDGAQKITEQTEA